jgi:NADPH:quinone reductase-like Zn-dependent oxidoreductase
MPGSKVARDLYRGGSGHTGEFTIGDDAQVRVAGISRVGGPVESLEVADARAPREHEVLIAVMAAGVGNWDEYARTGGWDVGRAPPMALGVEAAGVVAAIGHRVKDWAVGDQVLTHPLPLRDQGSWAPQLLAPAALLAEKPRSISWNAAAAFSVPALTAEQVIAEALDVQAGDQVLVNGAAGVTGALIVSLAAMRGASVIATASPSNHKRLKGLGACHPIDYHDAHWPERVREVTGGNGVSSAANAVPGGASEVIRLVRDGGRLATITSDPPDETRGIDVSSIYVRPDGAQLRKLVELLGAVTLEVPVGSVFRLDDAAAALAASVRGRGRGAIVVVPPRPRL